MFTTTAIDNIDHNPSSATVTEAFHGTSISIFQHPEQEQSQEVPLFAKEIEKFDVPLELPQSYSTIFPDSEKTESIASERISWSAFHARQEHTSAQPKSLCTLLPLLRESVASTTVVRHTMKSVNTVLQELNPGQATVLTGDQPVYAIGKQVQ